MKRITTGIEHAAIALVIHLALWPVIGAVAAGVVAVALFLGREIAQHEYKLALERGWTWGETPPVKWYEGAVKGWDVDSLLDVLFPVIGCGFLALLLEQLP